MKKIAVIMSALALMTFASCEKENQGNGGIDFDTVAEDGFYVSGPAAGTDKYTAEYMMNAGFNEVEKAARSGMYEKYIWLEANKDFELVLVKGSKGTRYSAVLEDFDVSEKADNPAEVLKRGILVTGDSAPAMQVKETGMYHIILDLNEKGDLSDAMIVLAPAKWGLRGNMNGWGYTEGEVKKEGNVVTYTWKDQRLVEGKEFKFAHCHGWKVNLDDLGLVKAEISFGEEERGVSGLEYTSTNITVEKTGLYTIVLKYEMKNGPYKNSFSYTTECTEEIVLDFPKELYMIGQQFGAWTWTDPGVASFAPVNGKPGHFWLVRHFNAADGFKFCAVKEWNGDFTGEKWSNSGLIFKEGNCFVEKDGLYLIYVNYETETVTLEEAAIYGMGDAFGSWDAKTEAYKFSVVDGKAVSPVLKAGNLRMYAEFSGNISDWWTREFNVFDGQIVYRGNDGDQAAVPVTEGQVVTLDFNAGTGSIQ